MAPLPGPIEHKRDKRHGAEPLWVEIAFGHIVLRFVRAISGVCEKKPRKNLDRKRFPGKSATYIHDIANYKRCCEAARIILCPALYRSWVDEVDERRMVIAADPPPQPTPTPKPPKGPEQGSLF